MIDGTEKARSAASGPLAGLRVLEFDAIGPVPFACMLLADMGAEIVTLARPGRDAPDPEVLVGRGRSFVHVDLKDPDDRDQVLDLIANTDVLVEGFRPGVMERLGLGPEQALARNPALVYGRMTGWGQSGPLAHRAGHDLNYISVTGALAAIGTPERPIPPLNLVGDFGGGAMFLLVGTLAALTHVRAGGAGQVVDAAMCDGATALMSPILDLMARGRWSEQRGANILDGGWPWYGVYECADGKFMSLAAIEPQFWARFLEMTGLDQDPDFADQNDSHSFGSMREKLTALFHSQPQAHWTDLLADDDCCVAPVLTMSEVPAFPHMAARGARIGPSGTPRPASAPRFESTPTAHAAPGRIEPMLEIQNRWGSRGKSKGR